MTYYSDGINIWTSADPDNKQIMQDDSPVWIEYVNHLKAGGYGYISIAVKSIEEQLEEVNNWYEEETSKLTRGMPNTERETWTLQEQEANAYMLDNTAVTEFIDELIKPRLDSLLAKGLTTETVKPYMVSKILEKASIYKKAVGKLTGERQDKEYLILNSIT